MDMTGIFELAIQLFASEEVAHGAEKAAEHAGGHHVSWLGLFVYVGITLAIMFYALSRARAGMKERVFKNWWTQRFEQVYGFIESLCVGIIGPHGKKYMPFMITIWLVIFFSNLVALFAPTGPTADLSWNLGMAFIAIGYVQYEGIKANGLIGHLSHFAGPKMGIAMIAINIMIFAIEIVSELMKNVSLSLRLFGNIHGGHQAVEAMNALGSDFFIPFGFFLMPVKALTVIVQALIFTLLTCVYLSLVTAHHDDHDHGHDAHGEAVPAH